MTRLDEGLPPPFREKFPTPHAVATASLTALYAARVGSRPSNEKMVQLQQLAKESIGTKDANRQHSLIFEQTQLIKELKLLQEHLEQLDTEIGSIDPAIHHKQRIGEYIPLQPTRKRRKIIFLPPK